MANRKENLHKLSNKPFKTNDFEEAWLDSPQSNYRAYEKRLHRIYKVPKFKQHLSRW